MSIPRGLHDNSVRPVHQNRERKSVPLSPKWFAATEIEMEKSMREQIGEVDRGLRTTLPAPTASPDRGRAGVGWVGGSVPWTARLSR